MKVAIPLFENRVSPRFDCAPKVLVATVQGKKVVRREEFSLASYDPFQRTALLSEHGVSALICGAIMGFSEKTLLSQGVQVICPVCGDAEEALRLFAEGRLTPEPFFPNERPRRGGFAGRRGRCRRGAGRWKT